MTKLPHLIVPLLVILVSGAMWMPGCGGSGIENPVQDADWDRDKNAWLESVETEPLNVKIDVSETIVQSGESVQLTATVEGVEGVRVLLDWINVTEHGSLSVMSPNSATWVAPQILGADDVRLEVIQFVVTVLRRFVAVRESGVDTDTQVSTETRTVFLTVVAS